MSRDLALSNYSQNFIYSLFQAWINSINAFMNFVKRFLVEKIRRKVEISRDIKVLLLLASDFFIRS